eukprot:scaffold39018_cov60-Phaeocystis_antarctica.AAC.5
MSEVESRRARLARRVAVSGGDLQTVFKRIQLHIGHLHLERDSHGVVSGAGQIRHLRPRVGDRVVGLHRAYAHIRTVTVPAKDIQLAANRCGGVVCPSRAHACQWRPHVGLRIEHHDLISIDKVFVTVKIDAASHVDLATHGSGHVPGSSLWHACNPLPAVGLGVIHFDRVQPPSTSIVPAHDVDLAGDNRRSVFEALDTHARHL